MLWQLIRRLFTTRKAGQMRDAVRWALALHLRGEARTDDLVLIDLSVRMQLRWRAREIHPWDRDLPPSRAAKKLAEQSLADTEAALERLFSACPDVDVVELSVMEPDGEGDRRIIFGAVQRNEFQQWHPLSTNMRLRLVGLHFRMVDDHMDPLPPERMEADVSIPAIGGGSGNETKTH